MPRGSRNLQVTFGPKRLTHSSGVYFIYSFLMHVELKHTVSHDIRIVQLNNRYSVPTRATSISSCIPTLDELMQTDVPATGVSAHHPSDSSPQDLPDAGPVAWCKKPTLLNLAGQRTEESRMGVCSTTDHKTHRRETHAFTLNSGLSSIRPYSHAPETLLVVAPGCSATLRRFERNVSLATL